MTSRKPNNTKTRRASTGNLKTKSRKTSPDWIPDNDDGWLSTDDLHQPEDANDWQRNGQTEHEAAVDYYFHRYTRPAPEREPTAGTIYRAAYEALILKYGDYDSVPCEEWSKIIHTGDGSKIDPAGAVYEAAYKALIMKYGDHDSVPWEEWRKIDPTKDFNEDREERMSHNDDNVRDFEAEKAKRKASANGKTNADDDDISAIKDRIKNKTKEKKPFHLWVAEGFFIMMDRAGDDLKMVRDKNDVEQMYYYDAKKKLWSIIRDEDIFLDRKLQAAVIELENPNMSSAKLLAGARKHVRVHPRLYPANIFFDAHGLVPLKGFLIDPSTKQQTPMTREHHCTWFIDVTYDPNATCPHWHQLMNDAFADRDDVERRKTIDLLQDVTGASLISKRDKALRRTLCIYGPSNSGKSSLIEVMSGVRGTEPISTSLTELSGTFGLEEFTRSANWVLHEAFDQGTWHLSSRAKQVISGNKISINGKNRKAYTTEIDTAGFWATNHPLKFKEATRAMIERLLVVDTKQVFNPKVRVGVAVEAHKHGFKTPESFILEIERPGLLNWALDGAKRVLEPDRGYFKDTESGEAALEEIHRDSNAIKGFIEDCTEYDCNKMVSTPDLQLAYTSWYQETKGEDHKVPSPDLLGRSLRALADPRIAQDNTKFRDDKGVRFYPGIVLNDVGCAHWQAGDDAINQAGPFGKSSKSAGRISSTVVVAKGKDVPDTDTWNNHPLIKQIRAYAKKEREKTKKEPKL